jgi:hypothetical protein
MSAKKDPPAVSLAKRIVDRLEKEELLDVTRVNRFIDSLATGKLRDSDWKLATEAIPRPKKKPMKRR